MLKNKNKAEKERVIATKRCIKYKLMLNSIGITK